MSVELLFMPSVYAPCPTCHGARYNADTLKVSLLGKSIADVLHMTVEEARSFFEDEPSLRKLPESEVEMAYRVLELLTHGKMNLQAGQLQGITRVVSIRRRPTEHDGVSGQLDYSPERIDELIELGMLQAEEAWTGTASNPAGMKEAQGEIQLPRVA